MSSVRKRMKKIIKITGEKTVMYPSPEFLKQNIKRQNQDKHMSGFTVNKFDRLMVVTGA